MFARVRQFFMGVFERPGKKEIDMAYKFLDERERKIFFKLPYYEEMHGFRVAEYISNNLKNTDNESNDIIKAALLHDVGKLGSGLNLITKSIMVILDALFHEKLKKCTSNKMVNAYYNHAEIGAETLNFESDRVKYLVLNHHNYNIYCDEELKLLQEADDKN